MGEETLIGLAIGVKLAVFLAIFFYSLLIAELGRLREFWLFIVFGAAYAIVASLEFIAVFSSFSQGLVLSLDSIQTAIYILEGIGAISLLAILYSIDKNIKNYK
ncbi:MAG: hypothetical protein QXW70_00750 [Candidatus Anstonellales archaeon]